MQHTNINEFSNDLISRIGDEYLLDIEDVQTDASYFVYVKLTDVSNIQYLSGKLKGLKIIDIDLEEKKKLQIRDN